MRKTVLLTFCFLCLQITTWAQKEVFNANIYNKVYDVEIVMNLSKECITIPGQAILGEVYGYLKKRTDTRVWIITDAKISKDGKKAEIEMINDYASEDLNAELIYDAGQNTYTLRQLDGSTIKVAKNKKWQKLPKEMVFEPKG